VRRTEAGAVFVNALVATGARFPFGETRTSGYLATASQTPSSGQC
jgi:acyl-CoA reductase-like NAD-dependent aldehyde dehydrogenase